MVACRIIPSVDSWSDSPAPTPSYRVIVMAQGAANCAAGKTAARSGPRASAVKFWLPGLSELGLGSGCGRAGGQSSMSRCSEGPGFCLSSNCRHVRWRKRIGRPAAHRASASEELGSLPAYASRVRLSFDALCALLPFAAATRHAARRAPGRPIQQDITFGICRVILALSKWKKDKRPIAV